MQDVIHLQAPTPGQRCCGDVSQSQLELTDAQQLSEDFQIFGHPVRLQILAILSQAAESVCVCDLEAALPIKQPTVSHHLKLLREAGLIDCERRGQWAYYFTKREEIAERWARICTQFERLV